MSDKTLTDEEFLGTSGKTGGRLLTDEEFLGKKSPREWVQARPAPKPGMSYLQHLQRYLGEGADQATRGNAQMFGRDSTPWERVKGFGNTVGGGLGMVSAPIDAGTRRLAGNAAEKMAADVGASPQGQVSTGDVSGLIASLVSGGLAAKAPKVGRALVGMAEKAGETGAELVNRTGRALTRDMENLPPGSKAIKARAQDLYDYAFNAGVGIDAAKATQFTADAPEILKAKNIVTRNAPINTDIYPETKKVLDRMENHYAGRELTLRELDDLRQEMNAYIQKTYTAAGAATRDTSGVQALRRHADALIEALKADSPEAIKALDEAKDLWRRQAKMDTIENIRTVAEKLNKPEFLQAEFRKIVEDPMTYGNFTKQERELIDVLARKSTLEDIQEVLPPISAIRRGARAVIKTVTHGGERATVNRLLDMIAGGEAAQAEKAAAKAAKPSFSESIDAVLNPNDMRPNKFDPYYKARAKGAYKQPEPNPKARDVMERAREESKARSELRGR